MGLSKVNTLMHGVLTLAASPESASIKGSCIGWPESINATPFVSCTLNGTDRVDKSSGALYLWWVMRLRYYWSIQTGSSAEENMSLHLPAILNALESDPSLSGSAMHCHVLRVETEPPLVTVGGVDYRRADVLMSVKERVLDQD